MSEIGPHSKTATREADEQRGRIFVYRAITYSVVGEHFEFDGEQACVSDRRQIW